jgi:hypothetical protein
MSLTLIEMEGTLVIFYSIINMAYTLVLLKRVNNLIKRLRNKDFVEASKKRIQEIQMPLDVKQEGGAIPPTAKVDGYPA